MINNTDDKYRERNKGTINTEKNKVINTVDNRERERKKKQGDE